jgi:glycosyltransferase involved in cell wall biosynthesis
MAERVQLVYIINSLGVGGAEIGMCRLFDGLDANSYDITVFALDEHTAVADQIPSWVDVVRLRSASQGRLRVGWRLFQSIRKADVIVGSLFHAAMIAKLGGLLNRGGKVFTWRHNTSFKTSKRKAAFKWTTGLTDVVLADSAAVAETLIDELGIDDDIVHTVPIAGIDPSSSFQAQHEETDTIVVGTVGNLIEQKNHATVLDVAEQLQGSGIRFEIGGDGLLREELEAEIRQRALSNVTLHGYVDDIPEFLSSLDIYFQPSHYEGLCITVLEAMAAGLPVVGSDVGGIGRNVEHGRSGLLYVPDNRDGFASAIRELAEDSQQRAAFGNRGRKTVEDRFTQEQLVSEFESAISDV